MMYGRDYLCESPSLREEHYEVIRLFGLHVEVDNPDTSQRRTGITREQQTRSRPPG